MNRLNKKQIFLIKKLAKKGNSLNKICKRLCLQKSIIYYWVRKTIGRKINIVSINSDLEEEIGEIVGVFAGDGNFYMDKNYNYKIRFYLSFDEMDYAEKIKNLITRVYGRTATIYTQGKMFIVQISSKAIINNIKEFLIWDSNKTYSVQLKNPIDKYSKNFLKGFCRGLIKADGWITKNNLMISCVSDELMNDLSKSLEILKLPHLKTSWKRKDERKRQIALFFNKENTKKFLEIVHL